MAKPLQPIPHPPHWGPKHFAPLHCAQSSSAVVKCGGRQAPPLAWEPPRQGWVHLTRRWVPAPHRKSDTRGQKVCSVSLSE